MRLKTLRLGKLGGLLGAFCLAGSFLLAATGPASASPPHWVMKVVNLPSEVGAGSAMGYQVTITNNGPSNISQLFLVTKTGEAPAYVSTSQGSCLSTPRLGCTLGALNAKKSVVVVVAYTSPFTDTDDPGNPVFQANSNGLTYSDGGTSHGDTLTDPNETGTVISTSGDFAGGFSLDDAEVSTQGSLSDSNKQSTTVDPPATDAPLVVTAEDGPTVTATCKKICTKAFGEWSSINVGNGATFNSFFTVTLTLRAVDAPTNLSKIMLAHVLDNGTTVELAQCKGTTLQNCIVVTKVGTNVQIKAYLNQNGKLRGVT